MKLKEGREERERKLRGEREERERKLVENARKGREHEARIEQRTKEQLSKGPVPWLIFPAMLQKEEKLFVGEDEIAKFRENGVFDFMPLGVGMRVRAYKDARKAHNHFRYVEGHKDILLKVTEAINQYAPERLEEKIVQMQEISKEVAADDPKYPALLFHMTNRIRNYIDGPDLSVGGRSLDEFAFFCARLCETIPLMETIFEGMMIKKCPFIVPKYLKNRKGVDRLVRVAYAPDRDDPDRDEYVEEEEGIMAKMIGIFANYIANRNVPPSAMWLWLSIMSNADVNPVMLEMIAIFAVKHCDTLANRYGSQFTKLIVFILQKYCDRDRIPDWWSEDDRRWWNRDKMKLIVDALMEIGRGVHPFPTSSCLAGI
jgi:hypothetical protein